MVSAIIPVVNAEVYVLVSQVSAVAGVVPVAVGVGIGQTIGKCLLFLGVRRGRQFRFVREHRASVRTEPRGRVRQAWHDALQLLLRLVGTKRWGLPITFLAAVVGVPPLYAVALLAGATTMKLRYFARSCWSGGSSGSCWSRTGSRCCRSGEAQCCASHVR